VPAVKLKDGFRASDPNAVQVLVPVIRYFHFHDVGMLADWSVNRTINGASPDCTSEMNAAVGAVMLDVIY
jgi:hypothetical protein